MSEYNFSCGANTYTNILLSMLNINMDDIPRYRACYVTQQYIVIYTKTGNANKTAYQTAHNTLRSHPLCEFVEDDSLDPEYANFYFTFPLEHKTALLQLANSEILTAPKPSKVT